MNESKLIGLSKHSCNHQTYEYIDSSHKSPVLCNMYTAAFSPPMLIHFVICRFQKLVRNKAYWKTISVIRKASVIKKSYYHNNYLNVCTVPTNLQNATWSLHLTSYKEIGTGRNRTICCKCKYLKFSRTHYNQPNPWTVPWRETCCRGWEGQLWRWWVCTLDQAPPRPKDTAPCYPLSYHSYWGEVKLKTCNFFVWTHFFPKG